MYPISDDAFANERITTPAPARGALAMRAKILFGCQQAEQATDHVSQAEAELPNFPGLAREVIRSGALPREAPGCGLTGRRSATRYLPRRRAPVTRRKATDDGGAGQKTKDQFPS
jgi:hypothetical protein